MTRWCYDKTLLYLRGSGGMPPPPHTQKFLNLRLFQIYFRPILIRVDMEALQL